VATANRTEFPRHDATARPPPHLSWPDPRAQKEEEKEKEAPFPGPGDPARQLHPNGHRQVPPVHEGERPRRVSSGGGPR